jgi:hypothetical protein
VLGASALGEGGVRRRVLAVVPTVIGITALALG